MPAILVGCVTAGAMLAQFYLWRTTWARIAIVVVFGVGETVTLLEMLHLFGSDVFHLRPISSVFDVRDWAGMMRVPQLMSGFVIYTALIGISACIIYFVLRRFRWPLPNRWWTAFAFLIFAVGLLTWMPAYDRMEYAAYSNFYDGQIGRAWDWLNETTNGDTIANIGNNVPLPLHGTRLKNDVVYIVDPNVKTTRCSK